MLRKNQEEAKSSKSDTEPVRIEVKVLARPMKIMQMWDEKRKKHFQKYVSFVVEKYW